MPITDQPEAKPRSPEPQTGIALRDQAMELAQTSPHSWNKNSAASENEPDSLLITGIPSEKEMRKISGAATIFSSGVTNFVREGAHMNDLNNLRNVNPANWGNPAEWNKFSLASVRHTLQHNKAIDAWRLPGEDHALDGIRARGAAKGVVLGAGAIVANCAVDAMFFSDTPRSWVSNSVDLAIVPAIGFAPINPYLKAAAMIGVHSLSRVYDRYYGNESWYK